MAIHITSLQHRLGAGKPRATDDMHVKEPRWFAVRTSHKHEKLAARELRAAGIECFLPLREKVHQYPSKTVVREIPLLSGYVFVKVVLAEEMTVRKAHYTSVFLRIGRERRRVTQEEIDTLTLLSTDRHLGWEEIEEKELYTEGTPVEIIHGPLSGLRGYYVGKKSKKSFVVSLGSMSTLLSTCEIDPRYLAPLQGMQDATVRTETATDTPGRHRTHW